MAQQAPPLAGKKNLTLRNLVEWAPFFANLTSKANTCTEDY